MSPSSRTQPLLASITEACEILGISRDRIYGEIAQGRLLSVKIGRRRLIPVSSLEAFVDLLEVEATLGRGAA